MGNPRLTIEITGKEAGFGATVDKAKRDVTGLNRALTQANTKADVMDKKLRKGARGGGRGGGGRSGGSFLGGIATGFTRSIGSSIFGVISSGVSDVRDFERGMARLAIAQGKTNDQMGGFRSEVTKISADLGVDRNEVLAGAAAYQALTGDTKGAAQGAKLFAKVATATGGSVEDAADTAAALSQNLKIDPKDFEAAFDVLNTQGKAGAVELKDLAGELAGLAPQWKDFAGSKGVGGMTKLGAATQIVRRNFGSAAEASTGMRQLMTSLVKNGKKLEAGGAKVFWKDKKGQKHLRDFDQIVDSISHSKLMKDPTALSKALGGSGESLRALSALITFRSDWKQLEDGSAAKGSIDKDANQYLESDAGKLDKAYNKLKLTIAQAFSPEIVKAFASAVGTVADVVNKVVSAAKGVIDEIGNELFGKDEAGRVTDMRAERGYERTAQLARAGKLGNVDARTLKLLDASAKVGRDALYGLSSEDAKNLDRVILQGQIAQRKEDVARESVFAVKGGAKGYGLDQVLQSANTVLGGSDAAANKDNALAALRKAALAPGAAAGRDDLRGIVGAYQTEDRMARAIAKAFVDSLKIQVVMDANPVAKAAMNASNKRRAPAHP